MTKEELIERLRHHEGDDLEFKEVKGSAPQSAYKTVSAFANTRGGTIVFGIRDHGTTRDPEIVGIGDPNRVRDDFLNALRSRGLGEHVEKVEKTDINDVAGRSLLVFRIGEAEAAQKPVCVDGKRDEAYLRRGSSDHRCTDNEYDRLVVAREMLKSGNVRTEPERYSAGSARIQDLWRSTRVPKQPNGAMTWLRTVWVTGRPVGPPLLDEVQRTRDGVARELVNAAFLHLSVPAGRDIPMECHREDRHLRLVRGDFETPFPGHVLSEWRVYADGAIVTSDSVAGEEMERNDRLFLNPDRVRGAIHRTMVAVCAMWGVLDGDIVRERPFYDVWLQRVGRRVLGVEPPRTGIFLHEVRPCPKDPVKLLDAPRIWNEPDDRERHKLVHGILEVVTAEFESWKNRFDGQPFGWP